MSAQNTNPSPTTQLRPGVPPEPPEALHQAGVSEAQEPEEEQDQVGTQDEGEHGADGPGRDYTGMSATYSPDDNKLRLYSVSRLDRATYERVKAAGFAWAPKQGFFVAPMWTPGRADLLIELCGEIGDEDTSLVERAEERADRFEDYSGKRGREADGARRAVRAIADNIPLGQPILVGHHSERHARRHAQRIEDGMRRAIKLWDTSKYWQQRAAGALRNANEGPMGIWSALDGGVITVEQARAMCLRAHAATIEGAQRWIEHYDHRLAYERAMLGEQGGIAASQFELQVGGRVLVRDTWSTILRLNKQDDVVVSVSTNSRSWPRVASIELIKGYEAPTEEAVKAAKTATKLPPLCNYPGDSVLTITQAQWNKVAKDHKGTRLEKATDSAMTHRVRVVDNFIARSIGTLAAAPNQWGVTRVFIEDARRVEPPKPAATAPTDASTTASTAPADATPGILAPERVATHPVYQKPAPTEFDAMREQLKNGVKVVSAPQLFPTPTALARRMVDLGKPQLGQRVLEPSSGTLRLLEALPFVVPFGQRRQTGLDVVAIEIQHDLAQLARQSGLAGAVHSRDFLEVAPEELGQAFDLVLMNPPFSNAADVKHIRHAVKFLKPGGRLVAICAAGPRQHEQLQPLVEQHGGIWEPLPADTFAEAGTAVRTVLLSFTVPCVDLAQAECPAATSTAD